LAACLINNIIKNKIQTIMKKLVLFMAVIFAVSFANAQTKIEIKVNDLQKVITDHINTNYAGYTINKAFKVDNRGVITYKVHVKKAADKLTLVYDMSGNFVKKVTEGQKTANAAKPTTSTQTTAKVTHAPKTGNK
jgi:hypothetical protein